MRRKKLTIRSFNPFFHGALGALCFLSFVFDHVAGRIRVQVGAEYCEEVGLGWSMRTRCGGAVFVFTFINIIEVVVRRGRLGLVILVCI